MALGSGMAAILAQGELWYSYSARMGEDANALEAEGKVEGTSTERLTASAVLAVRVQIVSQQTTTRRLPKSALPTFPYILRTTPLIRDPAELGASLVSLNVNTIEHLRYAPFR